MKNCSVKTRKTFMKHTTEYNNALWLELFQSDIPGKNETLFIKASI